MEVVASEYAEKLAKILIKKGKEYVKAALEKDAANRYSLKQTWYLPLIESHGLPAGEYHGRVINAICDGEWIQVWLNAYESTAEDNICDGATCFPDTFLGVDFRPGAAFHDPWYLELEDMAKAFGCEVGLLRDIGDDTFTSVNLAENAGKPFVETISTMVHWGVRIAGGIYHNKHKAVVAVAILLAALALGGCVTSVFENPGDYTSPSIKKVR